MHDQNALQQVTPHSRRLEESMDPTLFTLAANHPKHDDTFALDLLTQRLQRIVHVGLTLLYAIALLLMCLQIWYATDN